RQQALRHVGDSRLLACLPIAFHAVAVVHVFGLQALQVSEPFGCQVFGGLLEEGQVGVAERRLDVWTFSFEQFVDLSDAVILLGGPEVGLGRGALALLRVLVFLVGHGYLFSVGSSSTTSASTMSSSLPCGASVAAASSAAASA